jgi:hypothetical protein
MKITQQVSAMILGVALVAAPAFALSQSSDSGAKQDMKNAGTDTKNATKSAGNGIKKGTKKTVHATKSGTKKAYNKTANTTKGAVNGAKAGADKPATEKPQ